MSVSLEFLERRAAETGYAVTTLEKVTRLGEIASEVGRHPAFREALALKGGTAINLGFGAPTRMSVDLDYNFVGCADREGMLRARPAIEQSLGDILRRLGYQVRHSADATAGRKFYATYRSVLGPDDRVELDINYQWRTPLAGLRVMELWQPEGLDRPRVTVVADEELWVGKLLAFLDRTAPRDAWDVSRLPLIAAGLSESPALHRWLVALSFILDHPLETYDRTRLERRLTSDAIESQLHPMLAAGDRPDPAALLAQAWSVVESLVTLMPAEAEFIRRAQKADIDASLVFPDHPDDARRFETHPQVVWKLRNLQQHLARKV